MEIKIAPGELYQAIKEVVEEYTDDVARKVNREVDKVADETQANIINDSPVGASKTKKYKFGWRKTREKSTPYSRVYRIHNKYKYQLTHLLEYGHAIVPEGGRVEGKPHIRPNEERAVEELPRRIKEAIKG